MTDDFGPPLVPDSEPPDERPTWSTMSDPERIVWATAWTLQCDRLAAAAVPDLDVARTCDDHADMLLAVFRARQP